MGTPGENIENDLGPVNHPDFGEIGNRFDLGRGEFVIKNEEVWHPSAMPGSPRLKAVLCPGEISDPSASGVS